MIDCSLMESLCCSLAGDASSSVGRERVDKATSKSALKGGNSVNLAESLHEVAGFVCAIVVTVRQRTANVIIIFLIMLDFLLLYLINKYRSRSISRAAGNSRG